MGTGTSCIYPTEQTERHREMDMGREGERERDEGESMYGGLANFSIDNSYIVEVPESELPALSRQNFYRRFEMAPGVAREMLDDVFDRVPAIAAERRIERDRLYKFNAAIT
ncbi:hypothetical protein KIPB_005946, partial [Kipferlia bialata]|eukprot:g5946.t1